MPIKIFNERAILDLPQRTRANFINSLSGFKSANLIGTQSIEGVNNLSMVSSVFHVGANPPLIGMLIRPHTVKRDTL
ncbi:MAG: flavin reductase (DIM6/NTAB) family NADH-FMN oxidoreductase RutF, partial [Kangiellaceae bacterium]